jgi:hypothetical protein
LTFFLSFSPNLLNHLALGKGLLFCLRKCLSASQTGHAFGIAGNW